MKKTFLVFVTMTSIFTAGMVSAQDAHQAGHSEAGIAPGQAIELLKEGNQRFVDGKASHPHQDGVRRTELAKGQKPHTIVLSCSDSRVPPELVFDQGLGDVFPIRVAGNIVGAAEMASIEYAVAHLGAKLIVVMGHESCGAVKAAVTTPKEKSAGSPDLDHLIGVVQYNIGETGRNLASTDTTLRGPVVKNVDAVAERLTLRSKIVREAVERGDVKIVRAIYSLSSGKVDMWGMK